MKKKQWLKVICFIWVVCTFGLRPYRCYKIIVYFILSYVLFLACLVLFCLVVVMLFKYFQSCPNIGFILTLMMCLICLYILSLNYHFKSPFLQLPNKHAPVHRCSDLPHTLTPCLQFALWFVWFHVFLLLSSQHLKTYSESAISTQTTNQTCNVYILKSRLYILNKFYIISRE